MKRQNKIISLIFISILSFAFIDCSQVQHTEQEQPHLYWKNVDCVVTECDYRYWYASGCHYETCITVFNEEYNLEETFDLYGSEALEYKDLKKGDTVNCELHSLVLDSTGEVIEREIFCLK